MDFYTRVFEMIDFRSFSSMWYWIVLAVFWSGSSHFIMGVPFDLVKRVERNADNPTGWDDLNALARVNARRLLFIGSSAGLLIAASGAFLLSVLFTMGFLYEVEFCQALFLIAFPFSIVTLISQRTARLVLREHLEGAELIRRLKRQRLYTQMIGMFAIFVTAFWGMWHAMSIGVLG